MKQSPPTPAQNVLNAVWAALNGRYGLSIPDTVQDTGLEQDIYAELLEQVEAALDQVPFPPPSCLFDDDGRFLGYPDV